MQHKGTVMLTSSVLRGYYPQMGTLCRGEAGLIALYELLQDAPKALSLFLFRLHWLLLDFGSMGQSLLSQLTSKIKPVSTLLVTGYENSSIV